MPTGFKLYALVVWTHLALMLLVVGKIFSGALRFRARFVAFLGGTARLPLAKVRVRNRRIALCFDTALELGFAMIVAVDAEVLACKILRRQPNGLPVCFGPRQQRCAMPIILAIATRGGMPEDWRLRIYQGVAIVPLHHPMGGLPLRRVVSGDVPLALFAPLAPLRLMLGSARLNARCLLLYPLHRLVDFVLPSRLRDGAGGLPLLVYSCRLRQSGLALCFPLRFFLPHIGTRPTPCLGRIGGKLEAV